MIPRSVFLYAYGTEATMRGYINNSLSIYDISQIPNTSLPEKMETDWFNSSVITTCRYRGQGSSSSSVIHVLDANTLALVSQKGAADHLNEYLLLFSSHGIALQLFITPFGGI